MASEFENLWDFHVAMNCPAHVHSLIDYILYASAIIIFTFLMFTSSRSLHYTVSTEQHSPLSVGHRFCPFILTFQIHPKTPPYKSASHVLTPFCVIDLNYFVKWPVTIISKLASEEPHVHQ